MGQIQTVDVGSFLIEYTIGGREDLPVLAFMHGLSANMGQFTEQMNYFQEHYRVLLFSLRGHGNSGYPEHAGRDDFTLQKMVEDTTALLDALQIPAVHWVGNSMGGLVGYELLRWSPERLLSLTTFGTTAEMHVGETAVKLLTWTKDLMIKIMRYEGFARLAGKASSKDRDVQSRVTEMIMAAAPVAVRYAHMNIGDYNYTDVLGNADIPMLLIHCEHDKEINKRLKTTLEVLQQHASATVLELVGAGHFANLDRPADFNRILGDWLCTLGPR